MFHLQKEDVHLNEHAENKAAAIKKIAAALNAAGYVEEGYVEGMLEREEQAATYLGVGIAIPHGTPKTRDLVKKTGVQVFHFPDGIVWGDDEDEKAYIAVGIAASSDEHLTLLRQLARVLGDDDDVESKIAKIKNAEDVIAILTGESAPSSSVIINHETLLLDIPADSLSTLQALNASRLKKLAAVNTAFISHVLDTKPSYLGEGVWLSDAREGNLKNAVVVSRPAEKITEEDVPVAVLLTISAENDAINHIIDKLALLAFNDQLAKLHSADATQLLSILTMADADGESQ